MEKIEELANEVREGLSDFCINECKSFCCRKGYLTVSHEELKLICEGEDFPQEIKEMWNGKFSINFDKFLNGCPAWKNSKCGIHSNEKRPQTCKDFPIFIVGKKIKISNRCPAKKENKFFKFEKDAKNLGYEIVEDFLESQ